MKKLISAALTAATLTACISMTAISASAETDLKGYRLPFEVTAPIGVSVSDLGGQDSLTSLNVSWSMGDSMSQWMSEMDDPNTHDAACEKLLKDYGIEDIFINTQIDWAIDDPENGWHYTKYWDGETWVGEDGLKHCSSWGQDRNYQTRVGEWDTVDCLTYHNIMNECWVMRGRNIDNDPSLSEEQRAENNAWFYGNDLIPGLKNQLKDDQYTLVEVDPETHEQAIKIDYTQHTTYLRARWAIEVRDKDGNAVPILSEWSEYGAVGKDAEKFEPYTQETLAPPVITGLKYYSDDFNGYPQIAVNLTVPEELRKGVSYVSANGGQIAVEWEARVPEGEWVKLQGEWNILAGDYVIALQNLAEYIINQNKESGVSNPDVILANGSPVELRARYFCSQYDGYNGDYIGEFYTPYSEVLTFGTQEMSSYEQPSAVESSVPDESKTEESITEASKTEESITEASKAEEKKGGFPVWIIILIIVVLIIIIIFIIILVMKKKKNDDNSTSSPANKQ